MREHYQMLADKDSKPHVYAIAAQARHQPRPTPPPLPRSGRAPTPHHRHTTATPPPHHRHTTAMPHGARRRELLTRAACLGRWQAYHALCKSSSSQSIVTSGESGSGKTENTKQAREY